MKLLRNEELRHVVGGALTAAFMTALVRGINAYLDIGRSLGSAIRRITSKSVCPV